MKLFRTESYFIATDSNHVSEHRRFVTPWFYVRMKSVHYVKVKNVPVVYPCMFFYMAVVYSGWQSDTPKSLTKEKELKLDTLTSIFNTSIRE